MYVFIYEISHTLALRFEYLETAVDLGWAVDSLYESSFGVD